MADPETVSGSVSAVPEAMLRKLIWVVGEAVCVSGLGYALAAVQAALVAKGLAGAELTLAQEHRIGTSPAPNAIASRRRRDGKAARFRMPR